MGPSGRITHVIGYIGYIGSIALLDLLHCLGQVYAGFVFG